MRFVRFAKQQEYEALYWGIVNRLPYDITKELEQRGVWITNHFVVDKGAHEIAQQRLTFSFTYRTHANPPERSAVFVIFDVHLDVRRNEAQFAVDFYTQKVGLPEPEQHPIYNIKERAQGEVLLGDTHEPLTRAIADAIQRLSERYAAVLALAHFNRCQDWIAFYLQQHINEDMREQFSDFFTQLARKHGVNVSRLVVKDVDITYKALLGFKLEDAKTQQRYIGEIAFNLDNDCDMPTDDLSALPMRFSLTLLRISITNNEYKTLVSYKFPKGIKIEARADTKRTTPEREMKIIAARFANIILQTLRSQVL